MKKIKKYELIFISFFLALLLIYLYTNYYDFITVKNLRSALDYFGSFAPFIYFLIFVILAIVGFPISVLYFMTGILFGFVVGYFLSVFAATVAGIIAFMISRHFIKNVLNQAPRDENTKRSRLIASIKESAKDHGFYNIFILRLYMMPYIELSYGAGLVRDLKSKDYILATFIVNFIEGFIFIFLGFAFLENIYFFFIALVFAIMFILFPRFYKRHHFNLHFRNHN